jgi:hypothetical protein
MSSTSEQSLFILFSRSELQPCFWQHFSRHMIRLHNSLSFSSCLHTSFVNSSKVTSSTLQQSIELELEVELEEQHEQLSVSQHFASLCSYFLQEVSQVVVSDLQHEQLLDELSELSHCLGWDFNSFFNFPFLFPLSFFFFLRNILELSVSLVVTHLSEDRFLAEPHL